jgi:hypothetical protein
VLDVGERDGRRPRLGAFRDLTGYAGSTRAAHMNALSFDIASPSRDI